MKSSFGTSMSVLFPVLSAMKFLRGSPLDIFGYSAERRMERRILSDFVAELDQMAKALNSDNKEQVEEFLSYPAGVRGYGHVKLKNYREVHTIKENTKVSILGDAGKTHAIAAE